MEKKEEIDSEVIKIAEKFDELCDLNQFLEMRELIPKAIRVSEKKLNSISEISINYAIGTAYGNILLSFNHLDKEFDICQEKQLYYLRKAQIIEQETGNIPLGLRMQLYTNLGNAYAGICRINDSIEAYREATKLNSDFGMANGNLAIELKEYADCLFDSNDKAILYHKSYEYFNKCFKDEVSIDDKSKKIFVNIYEKLLKICTNEFFQSELEFNNHGFESKEEIEYREWCSENSLFLNPINDILDNSSFMNDWMHLPGMIFNVKSGLDYKYHGLFNEIKQEYISSRYTFFETILSKECEHFSDRETNILNTLDYTVYSLDIWKLKTVFRSLYSLLDKIAFFINEYMDIGIKERDINYKSIWYTKNNKYKYKNPIINKIKNNKGLYGLFWIFKDFFEGKQTTTNPRILEIVNIRNSLEHKYLKIVDNFFDFENHLQTKKTGEMDKLAFYISKKEFAEICLWLLKTIRALIINLLITINIEETRKKNNNQDKIIPSIPLSIIEDEWKISSQNYILKRNI